MAINTSALSATLEGVAARLRTSSDAFEAAQADVAKNEIALAAKQLGSAVEELAQRTLATA